MLLEIRINVMLLKNEKKLKNIIKTESVKLPNIVLNENGTYSFSGEMVDVSSLEELNEYKKNYSDIYDIVKESYKSQIANIYKKALTHLASNGEKNSISNWLDKIFNGKAVTGNKLFMQKVYMANETENAVKDVKFVVNFANEAKGFVPEFKPFDVASLLGERSKEGISYILPEINENGVVAKIDDKHFDVNLIGVDDKKAEEIKNFIFDEVIKYGDRNREQTEKIFKLFSISRTLADGFELGNSKMVYKNTRELAEISMDLFGIDNSKFIKQNKKVYPVVDEDFEQNVDAEGFEDEEQINQKQINESEKELSQKFEVDSIDMKTPYMSECGLDDNKNMVITLKANGDSFVVKIKNGKMEVFNKAQQTSEFENEL